MEQQLTNFTQKPLRLECQGFPVGDHWIPAFRLHAGEAVCLHGETTFNLWHETLVPLFKGTAVHPGLHLHGTATYLERPLPQRGWFGRRKDCSVRDWLITKAKLSPGEVPGVLERIAVPPDLRIGM